MKFCENISFLLLASLRVKEVNAENSWYIANTGKATYQAISKDIMVIKCPFNSTNRETGALVFKGDCVTPFPSTNYIVADTTTPTSSQPDGYIQFNTTLEMNVTALSGTEYWNTYTDGTDGGWVELCCETFLSFEDSINLGNDDTKTKVVFKKKIMNVTFSFITNFEIEVSKQREVSMEDVDTDFSNFVSAYECDETDLYNKKIPALYNQGNEITICVRDDNTGNVQVEQFVNLVVAQKGNTDYNFILDGKFNPDITTSICVDSTTHSDHRVCYAKIRALKHFFLVENPPDLTFGGGVNIIRDDGRRVRRILRSAPPNHEKNNEENALYASSRRVNEDTISGDFEVKVGLASADNSASSACTIGSTSTRLMWAIAGAAGVTGAALMG